MGGDAGCDGEQADFGRGVESEPEQDAERVHVPRPVDQPEEPTDEDGAVFDSTGMGAGEGTDLFAQAVQIVKRDRKASTSYIQRRLQIGYNRAASLMERMELEGIVGQANHAGKREILVEEEEGRF